MLRLDDTPLSAFRMETPVGSLVGVIDPRADGALARLDFAHPKDPAQPPTWRGLRVTWDYEPAAVRVMEQIAEYFSGKRRGLRTQAYAARWRQLRSPRLERAA